MISLCLRRNLIVSLTLVACSNGYPAGLFSSGMPGQGSLGALLLIGMTAFHDTPFNWRTSSGPKILVPHIYGSCQPGLLASVDDVISMPVVAESLPDQGASPGVTVKSVSQPGLPGYVELDTQLKPVSIYSSSNKNHSHLLLHKGGALCDPLDQPEKLLELINQPPLDLRNTGTVQPVTRTASYSGHLNQEAPDYKQVSSIQVFLNVDENGYLVVVIVELLPGHQFRIRTVRTSVNYYQHDWRQHIDSMTRFNNVVFVPVGELLQLSRNKRGELLWRFTTLDDDCRLELLRESQPPLPEIPEVTTTAASIVGGGILAGDASFRQCPKGRKDSRARSYRKGKDEEYGIKVIKNDDETMFGPALPPEMQADMGQERIVTRRRSVVKRVSARREPQKITPKTWMRIYEGKWNDARCLIVKYRHHHFLNDIVSRSMDEVTLGQKIDQEIQNIDSDRDLKLELDLNNYWWVSIYVLEQGGKEAAAMQFMEKLFEMNTHNVALAHALTWNTLHQKRVEKARERIADWDKRKLFTPDQITKLNNMTSHKNARAIRRKTFSTFKPLESL